MAMDNIAIEILPDGSLKVTTDRVSMPNHTNAEKFLADLAREMGGETKRHRKAHSHAHAHGGHHHTH